MPDDPRYSIQDLADLADVSRRTVRHYVQEGLIPAPLALAVDLITRRLISIGSCRSRNCSRPGVRSMRSAPRWMEVRSAGLSNRPSLFPIARSGVVCSLPGIEIHVENHITLPGPNRLRELADWCRLHFTSSSSE